MSAVFGLRAVVAGALLSKFVFLTYVLTCVANTRVRFAELTAIPPVRKHAEGVTHGRTLPSCGDVVSDGFRIADHGESS